MRIIQISTFFHPVTGGVETQVKEIAEELMKYGHRVKILTTDSSRNNERIKIKHEIFNKIPVTRCRTWFSFSKFHKLAPGIFIQLLVQKYDVVHVHGFRKPEVYFALFVAKLRRKKVIVTTHNPFTTVGRSERLEKLVRLHDKTFGKWFTKKIDKIIALLPSEVEILEKQFGVHPDHIEVIPNGIAETFFQDIEVDKKEFIQELTGKKFDYDHIVLAACRLNEVKGLQNLQVAARELDKTLFLFLGGDDGYEKQLRKRYSKYKNVYIHGDYVDKMTLKKAYTIADLFVLPSLHEPFGLTPVEAVASGCPVIATDTGGTKEVLSDEYAVFISPKNDDLWYHTIKEMLDDEKLRHKMSYLGKQEVQRYRWKNVMKELLKVYID